jgi:hypothetical protein
MLTKHVESWTDLKSFFDERRSKGEFIWRGHASSQWTLSSSLYRYFEGQGTPADARRRFEAAAVAQFEGRKLDPGVGPAEPDRATMAPLPIMQHHGCPTRLIDWTWSPYIATYFVLPDMEPCGAIYGLDLTAYQSFLAPKLPLDDYDHGILPVLPDRIYTRFLETPDLVYPIPLLCDGPGHAIEQQSVFLLDLSLSDSTEVILGRLSVDVLWKIEVPREIRLDAHADLLAMNIDGAHLFPDERGRAIRAKEWLFGARWHGHSIKREEIPW